MFHIKDLITTTIHIQTSQEKVESSGKYDYHQAIVYKDPGESLFLDILHQGFDLMSYECLANEYHVPVIGEIFFVKIPQEDINLFKILFGDRVCVI